MIKLASSSPQGDFTPMSRRLFEAIRGSKLVQVKLLVYKNQLNINTKNEKGENSLIEALRIDDERKRRITFTFLLKCGIDVHNRDCTRRDSLEWATKLCRERQALQLLNGPMLEYDYQHMDGDGFTVLHYAAINNMEKVVQVILTRLTRYYISADIKDRLGLTPYLYAKRLRHTQVASALIDAGASQHVVDRNENKLNINRQNDKEIDEMIKLKINGRLPQLRRLLDQKSAEETGEGNIHLEEYSTQGNQSTRNNINSLLQLQQNGETCERFVKSTNMADIESNFNSTISGVSSYRSTKDLNEIFGIVSEQMTSSFCRPAQKPKPVSVAQPLDKTKMSTLAVIMKKPISEKLTLQQIGKRKSQLRKFSKLDMLSKS